MPCGFLAGGEEAGGGGALPRHALYIVSALPPCLRGEENAQRETIMRACRIEQSPMLRRCGFNNLDRVDIMFVRLKRWIGAYLTL